MIAADSHVFEWRDEDVAETDHLLSTISSCSRSRRRDQTHILMSQVFEQLELSVCSLGQNRRAEWLHDLLDSHSLAGKLIFGRAGRAWSARAVYPPVGLLQLTRPDRTLPCQQAGGQCIFLASQRQSTVYTKSDTPARDLEGRAEDLRTHKLGHLCCGRSTEVEWTKCFEEVSAAM